MVERAEVPEAAQRVAQEQGRLRLVQAQELVALEQAEPRAGRWVAGRAPWKAVRDSTRKQWNSHTKEGEDGEWKRSWALGMLKKTDVNKKGSGASGTFSLQFLKLLEAGQA